MEKRYQVFISSTYQDLQNARQEVSQALLEASCFPAGMELFPAANEEQISFIQKVIDQSDYYIIICAGKYGSINPNDPDRRSYTEMEYDYAVQMEKPIIRLLHRDIENLPDEKRENTDEMKARLFSFRKKLSESHLVRHWGNPEELSLEVLKGLMYSIAHNPGIGWVRSDQIVFRSNKIKDQIGDIESEFGRIGEKFENVSNNSSRIRKSLTILAAFAVIMSAGVVAAYTVLNRQNNSLISLSRSINDQKEKLETLDLLREIFIENNARIRVLEESNTPPRPAP